MAGQSIRRLTALVMIVGAAACDNVEWGGADMTLVPPPPATVAAPAELSGAEPDAPPPPLPEGPVLFMGMRSGDRITLRPVAEIQGSSLVPLSEESEVPGFAEYFSRQRMGPGTEFFLFARGVRVGTLLTDSSSVVTGTCGEQSASSGPAELIRPAAGETRFLALARQPGPAPAHAPFPGDAPGFDPAAVSLNLASRVIMREEAFWPDNLGAARGDLSPVALPEGAGVAATFLFRDRLEVAPSDSRLAYSLFVLGTGGPNGNALHYSWYREVEPDGKGAARLFSQADWDGDGEAEILLEVLGTDRRWFAALDLVDGVWERVFEEPCGAQAAQPTGG